MPPDPTTSDTLLQVTEAAAGEIETWLLRSNPDGWRAGTFRDIILRHLAPAFEQVEAQAAGMRDLLKQAYRRIVQHHDSSIAREGVYVCPLCKDLTLFKEIDAALAPDAGSALLARLAAAEKVAIAAQGYYLTTSDDGVMTDALREALATYRQLCPAGAGKDGVK